MKTFPTIVLQKNTNGFKVKQMTNIAIAHFGDSHPKRSCVVGDLLSMEDANLLCVESRLQVILHDGDFFLPVPNGFRSIREKSIPQTYAESIAQGRVMG